MPLSAITLSRRCVSFAALALIFLTAGFATTGETGATTSATPSFAGHWLDAQNSNIRMSVRKEAGLFEITGGDEAWGYQISCLLNNAHAVCTGKGGRLEGENFLYQSSFRLTPDGRAIESWKAFNNLQSVSGQTTWKRVAGSN